MGALSPGPEDAEKQENGADNLANPTHSLKTIPAAAAVTGPRVALQLRPERRFAPGPARVRRCRQAHLALGSADLISEIRRVLAAYHDRRTGARLDDLLLAVPCSRLDATAAVVVPAARAPAAAGPQPCWAPPSCWRPSAGNSPGGQQCPPAEAGRPDTVTGAAGPAEAVAVAAGPAGWYIITRERIVLPGAASPGG
jgi:hypothetical protein